jgi:outer membrane protein assembly factor BamB
MVWWLAAGWVVGWRHDGGGRFDEASPPIGVSVADATWRTPLAATGNGSPVRVGERLCFTAEPTSVVCADATTGAIVWQGTNDVVDAAPLAERDGILAAVAAADAASPRVEQLTADTAVVRRRVRTKDPDAPAQLAAMEAELAKATAVVEAAKAYRTPPSQPAMGWACPTPLFDGERLYTFHANGVVSAWTPSGERLWATWLGPRSGAFEFFDGLASASPALAGGRLVVAWDALVGLDPQTGAVVWEQGGWVDYGSPVAVDVEGLAVVLAPDGRVVRAADGALLAEGLGGKPWFNSPVWSDGVGYWVGGRLDARGAAFRSEAAAVRLRRSGDGVTAEPLWSAPIPSKDRFYASPLLLGDALLAVDNVGTAFVIDAATGAVRQKRALDPKAQGQVWAGPLRTASGVLVSWTDGTLMLLGPDLAERGRTTTEKGLAAPWLEGGTLWLRTWTSLLRFG